MNTLFDEAGQPEEAINQHTRLNPVDRRNSSRIIPNTYYDYNDDDENHTLQDGNALRSINTENERSQELVRNGHFTAESRSASLVTHMMASSDIDSALPYPVLQQLLTWKDSHDGQGPKCATNFSGNDFGKLQSYGNYRALWQHVSGVQLKVSCCKVPHHLNSQRVGPSGSWAYILAHGLDTLPRIIRFARRGGRLSALKQQGAFYKIWVGASGDTDGFEHDASVVKTSSPANLRPCADDSVQNSTAFTTLMPTSRRRETSNQPSKRVKTTDNTNASSTPRARPRPSYYADLDNSDVEELPHQPIVNSIAKRATSEIAFKHADNSTSRAEPETSPFLQTPSLYGASKASQLISSDLDTHIKENAQIIFFSTVGTSRTRSFNACDTVQKLFAQARAGDVFSQSDSRVLTIQVGDMQTTLPIVEGDTNDFDAFVTELRRASCWRVTDGKIRGVCIVQAKEKL